MTGITAITKIEQKEPPPRLQDGKAHEEKISLVGLGVLGVLVVDL